MAAVAGAQPPGGPPPGGSPPPPLYTGPVPPTRKCSKRQCTHMLEAPIDLKADGSDYYSHCWRCRGATSSSATKRRKLDPITTGSLIESLCNAPSSGQFASPPAQFTPPPPQFAPPPPRFAPPPGQLAPPSGQAAFSSTAV
jgi:hypothetical protein